MPIVLEKLIRKLQHDSTTQLAGSVKTLPLRDLLRNERDMQDMMEGRKNGLPSTPSELSGMYKRLQDVISKRLDVAEKLIEKFADTSPEIIALNTSIFSLVPSRDVLEDVKAAHTLSENQIRKLTKASANILEAVNIEIQQRFYELSPETIAVQYSGDSLKSYRKLLKNLLQHIEVGSDIFKVYSIIIRNLIKGSWLYETHIRGAHSLCDEIFRTDPPDFNGVFPQYSIEELETSATALRETLKILEQDVTGKPSIQEFARQCRHILERLSSYFLMHKIRMRKSTRVLQISHHIVSCLSTENISENAMTTLMICLDVFEETSQFLIKQQKHLDVALNVRSLDNARQKVQKALRYRQFSVAQLLQDISILAPEDLVLISGKYLDHSLMLLQEVLHLIEEYLLDAQTSPQQDVLELKDRLQENIENVSKAMSMRTVSPGDETQDLAFDSSLPTLSRFYDKELIRLIHKALNIGEHSRQSDQNVSPETTLPLPAWQLREFVNSFIRMLDNIQKSGNTHHLP